MRLKFGMEEEVHTGRDKHGKTCEMDLLISALASCLFLKSEKQKCLHVTSQDWMGLQFFISLDLELSTPVRKQTLRRLLPAQPFPLSGALSCSVGALMLPCHTHVMASCLSLSTRLVGGAGHGFLICICIFKVQLGSQEDDGWGQPPGQSGNSPK